jgi:hypothetical protein
MNLHKIKLWTVAAALAVGSLGTLKAQEPNNQMNREMTLEREYNPTIQDANKVSQLPETNPPDVPKQAFDYSFFTIPQDPETGITTLPSGNSMTEIPFNKRRGYLHFGGGMFATLNGDAGYHLLNNDKNKLNLFFSHRSVNGNVDFPERDETQAAKFNDNLGGFHFNHFFEKNAVLRMGINYNYTEFNYYGLPTALSHASIAVPVDRKTNQVNQIFNVYGGVRSKDRATTEYLLDIDFSNFTQQHSRVKVINGVRENAITLQTGFGRRLGSDENQVVGLRGTLDYFNYTNPSIDNDTDSSNYRNSAHIMLTPYYRIEGETWNVQLGANVMFLMSDSTEVFASPNLSAEVQLAERTLLYANAGGEIGSNDALGLSRQNRYLNHLIAVAPSCTWLDATLGLRSGITPNVWLSLFAGYKITNRETFFIPLTHAYPMDDFASYLSAFQADASLFRIGATLKYAYRKQVEFSVKGVYNNWSVQTDREPGNGSAKAYNRPAVEMNAGLSVKPILPLTLTFDYYLGAQRYTLLGGDEVKMKDINDLNFSAAWAFNPTFGAYVKLNNLFFQQQELFYGYPTLGFHAVAGININF